MNISAHFVRKITAEARGDERTAWVEMRVHRHSPVEDTESNLTLFFGGDDKLALATAYASAINSVEAAQ